MIEIALCIAIIGFALVAIIGVLPTAMRVQHDNRGDTLIDQDGQYFLEAIRHGAQGIDDLVDYVIKPTANHNSIRFVHWDAVAKAFITNPPPILGPKEYNTGRKLIGLLSIPRSNDDAFRVEMEFRGISGAAVEKDPNSIVGFEYLLVSEVVPFSAYDPITTFATGDTNVLPRLMSNMQNNLYELRLTFRWPLMANGDLPNNKKVFRTLVSGSLTNDASISLDIPHFYFAPTGFIPVP